MELYEFNLELMEMFLIISYYCKQLKLVLVLYMNYFLSFFIDEETNKIKLFYIILLFILLNTNLFIKYLHSIYKKPALICYNSKKLNI